MKKRLLGLLLGLVASMLLGCNAEEKGTTESKPGQSENETTNGNVDDVILKGWNMVQINGEVITLPCTVAKLEDKGVVIDELILTPILSSENQRHPMIIASCGETGAVSLSIQTGADSSLGKENASVVVMVNNAMKKENVILEGGIGLGSTIDEVISQYGDEAKIVASDMDNLSEGLVIVRYGSSDNGLLLNFQDGIMTYMELRAEGEE